jgi:hypothetical protein
LVHPGEKRFYTAELKSLEPSFCEKRNYDIVNEEYSYYLVRQGKSKTEGGPADEMLL